MATESWYKDWFNSPYYHILYKNRDYKEAEVFIDNLIDYLKPAKHACFLDVACGKGRHSIYLNKKGFHVIGIDLSENNIKKASKKATEYLQFKVQDMREPFKSSTFDYVLNLFTSFGYFKEEGDNQRVLDAAFKDLKKGGTLILDFFNAKCVLNALMPEETKTCEDITFSLHKKLEGNVITKDIVFNAEGKQHHYKEKVKAYTLDDLKNMLELSGFQVKKVFGSYTLEPFDFDTSDRLIIEAVK